MSSFDDLIAEGAAVPLYGWDFSWFEGRATEERPPWGYARMLGDRMAALAGVPGAAALDLQTGGGEVVASAPAGPAELVVTESWPPNIEVARRNLAARGGRVVGMTGPMDDLPFPGAAFDLVSSRHPVGIRWDEVARVLKPGGSYFSQDVGYRSVAELSEYLMGPHPVTDGPSRAPKWSVAGAGAAGLEVTDLREFCGRMEFFDIAAVVHFLRKVIWIVPDFTVDRYRGRLLALYEQIEAQGPFTAASVRFLIEARRPGCVMTGPAAATSPPGMAGDLVAVVLVEGLSDHAALSALAARRGRDLAAERVTVVAMGGATNIGHFLAEFGPQGRDVRLAGLCDAGEEDDFRRGLERAGLGAGLDRAGLERLGFFVCTADLEDELIRALGVAGVEQVVAARDELGSLRKFQLQPAQRGRPPEAQLRRFLGTRSGRKIAYGSLLVQALDLDQVPRPLDGVLACV